MIVKIGEREIEMHYSLRMYMLYENIVGESLDYTKLESYTTILNLFYCAVLSSMQYHKMELDLKFDEFIDWIDTEGITALSEFSVWYTENLMLQQELVDKATEKNNKKSDKKSDKKGKSQKNAK
jgi:hypothetical protein